MSTALPIRAPATAAGAPVAPAGPGTLAVPARALTAEVGQVLAARVVAVREGLAELALGGGRLMAATALPLSAGQTLRMVVAEHVEGRVVLRPQAAANTTPAAAAGAQPGAAPGTSATAAGPAATLAAALRGAGLSAGTVSALMATLAATDTMPAPAGFAALVAGAGTAGVATPAQAAAYVRLLAAGLPATHQAVAGLALLAEGAPLGRALAAVVDAARAASPPSAPGAAPVPGAAPSLSSGLAPSAPTAPPALPATAGPSAVPPSPTAPPASAALAVAPPEGDAAAAATPLPTAAPPAAPPGIRSVADALARAVAGVAEAAVSGDPEAVRAAVHQLGVAAPAAEAPAEAPAATVRALLTALAEHPSTEPALARAALAAGETIGAQLLAAPSTPAPQQATTGGAYLQIPLPGGGTAELRIPPDGGGGGEGDGERRAGPRTVAMLLHLSALGPVMVTARAGPDAVDARVRVEDEVARAFLARHAAELTAALAAGEDAPAARVSVETQTRGSHRRLLAPTPHDGVDRHA